MSDHGVNSLVTPLLLSANDGWYRLLRSISVNTPRQPTMLSDSRSHAYLRSTQGYETIKLIQVRVQKASQLVKAHTEIAWERQCRPVGYCNSGAWPKCGEKKRTAFSDPLFACPFSFMLVTFSRQNPRLGSSCELYGTVNINTLLIWSPVRSHRRIR